MSVKIKRVIATMLVVMLVLQPLGVVKVGDVEKVEAASALPIVNEAIVTERLKELARILEINSGTLEDGEGVLFTVNGSCNGCGGCDNCKNTNVIKSSWFKNKLGYTVDVALLPGHAGAGVPYSELSNVGYNCIGFANFALWYISKENSTSDVYRYTVGTKQQFTKANLQNSGVRIGDIINLSPTQKEHNSTGKWCHSVIFLGYSGDSGIKVMDCNWSSTTGQSSKKQCVKIHSINYSSYSTMAITRATNYEPDAVIEGSAKLPSMLYSTSSSTAKTNIINYAKSLEGWKRNTFLSVGRNDIPSDDWCTWFLKICGERVGISNLFSSKTTVPEFCTDMIKNYGAEAFYYSDSSYLTTVDKTVLSGATAVTKSTFTPQVGDIYVFHEEGCSGMNQVGFVTGMVNNSITIVAANNGTDIQTVVTRNTSGYTFYQLNNSVCPIVAYIRPNYVSLDRVALSGISLSATSVTLNVGDTKTLTVTYNPSNTTDSKTVTWKSSNASVAMVSNGKITAVSPGTATITATCGSKTATCTVTVKQPLSSIALSSTNLSMNVGTSKTLTVTYNPSNTTDGKTVTWKSSNTSVATVLNGKITAVAPGTATITAICGSKTATCTVTVKQPLSSIMLSSTTLSVNVGASQTLTVTYNPSNTTDSKTVIWKSSNTSVATVSNGKITAVAPGTATITVTCGSKTATCKVTVEKITTEIAISTKKLSMDVGGKNTLSVLDDTGATVNNKDVVWKSSNNSIATVSSSGVVTAVSDGTVTIYATTADGKVTTSCEVTVKVAETEIITTTKNEMTSTTNKNETTTTTSSVEVDSGNESITSESETTTLSNTDENLSSEKNEYETTLGENESLENENVTTNRDIDKSDIQTQHNYVLAMIITICICIAGIIVFLIVKKVRK